MLCETSSSKKLVYWFISLLSIVDMYFLLDASGHALSNREDGLSVEDDPNNAASISATAPTLSKLLGSSDGSQAEMYTGRRVC